MPAGTLDLEVEQGATLSQELVWRDSAAAPINLTGYSARMQIRETISAATILVDLTTANAKIVLGGAAGTITLNLTAVETAALSWPVPVAVYDLELVSGTGVVTRLLKGKVTLDPEVTR